MNTQSSAASSAFHAIKACMVLIGWYFIVTLSFSAAFSTAALADSDKETGPSEQEHNAKESHSGSYEAPLPVNLSTDPDLCAYVPYHDVFPNADHFSPRKGRPAYVEAYRNKNGKHKESDNNEDDGERELIGYVFLSTDIVDIPAYSGKPVVTLIGMNIAGKIVGVKVLRHSEPILLVGIPESELT